MFLLYVLVGDTLYGVSTGQVYTIDPATSAITFVVSAGTAVFAPVYDASTDTLYALTNDENAGTRHVVTIDTVMGSNSPAFDNTAAYADFTFVP